MPNYVINLVNLIGDRDRIFEVMNDVKNDELPLGSIDFNKIIPAPVDENGTVSCRWCMNHWGTNQNSIFNEDFDDVDFIDFSENDIQLVFVTAWHGAHPIVAKLASENPDLSFVFTWAADTIFQEECGRYIYVNGACVDRYYPVGKEAAWFSCEAWDLDAEDFLENFWED